MINTHTIESGPLIRRHLSKWGPHLRHTDHHTHIMRLKPTVSTNKPDRMETLLVLTFLLIKNTCVISHVSSNRRISGSQTDHEISVWSSELKHFSSNDLSCFISWVTNTDRIIWHLREDMELLKQREGQRLILCDQVHSTAYEMKMED